MSITIGVLVPKSKQFITIDSDFLSGIKLAFPDLKLHIETIGIGADSDLIIEKIQKLHFQENINIIVGLLGHWNINEILEYTSQHQILFIVNEIGATLPINIDKYDSVFINSYQLCESVYFLNRYFKENKISKIATSTSYYDCGYGILSAIEQGSIENNISIEGHYITPFVPRENEAELMNQTIHNIEPEAVIAFHSGLYAEEHATFLTEAKLLNNYKYFITPFTLNEKILKLDKNINIIGSWLPTSDCSFNQAYNKKYKKNASPISLLGFETGLIISNIVKENNDEIEVVKLNFFSIEGPRGKINFTSKKNRRFNYNYYIYQTENSNSSYQLFEKKHMLSNDGSFIKLINNNSKEQIGGWQNAYLCH